MKKSLIMWLVAIIVACAGAIIAVVAFVQKNRRCHCGDDCCYDDCCDDDFDVYDELDDSDNKLDSEKKTEDGEMEEPEEEKK